MQKIIAVLPCYCEEKYIRDLVINTKQYVDEVIVADDNSSDNTVKEAQEAGALVILNKSSIRGVGSNTNRGLRFALDKGADIIVTLDGDGQHNPKDIKHLIEPILNGQADFVSGNRLTHYKTIPIYRRLGVSVITATYNIFSNPMRVGDAQCGFRAYSRKLLESITIEERGYAFIVETLVKIRKSGFVIAEIPIVCLYHQNLKDNSTANPVSQGLDTMFQLIKWRLKLELFGR